MSKSHLLIFAMLSALAAGHSGVAAQETARDFDFRRFWSAFEHDPFKTVMACYQLRTDAAIAALAEGKNDAEFETALIGRGGYEAVSLGEIGYCNRSIKARKAFPDADPAFFEASDAFRRAMRLLDRQVVAECVTELCKTSALTTFVANVGRPTPKD